MRAEEFTEEYRTTALVPEVIAAAPDDVREVIPLPDHRLAVRFYDGVAGLVDLSALIASLEAGVFTQLREEGVFMQVRVEYGAVSWLGGIDLAPDVMYNNLMKTGF